MIGATSGSAGFFFGLVLAFLVGIVIIGGIKRIGAITERVVPFMVGIYLIAALLVIFVNIRFVPQAFGEIIAGAFSPLGITGGIVGVLVQGFRRAAFSNEAGIGSAAIAHSAVKTKYPASEGIVALLEPFVDTVVVCTITALVIIIANGDGTILAYGEAAEGVSVTSAAFATVIPWFPYVLTIAVVLFAFSTQLSWSYYGLQAWLYLFGRNKAADISYKILFLVFVVLGASVSLGAVIQFSDSMIFLMAAPNLVGVVLLLPVVKREINKYKEKVARVDAGEPL
jgi:AGCS family alanine or glycine:cation symporter